MGSYHRLSRQPPAKVCSRDYLPHVQSHHHLKIVGFPIGSYFTRTQ